MDNYLCLIAELDEETQDRLKLYQEILTEKGLVSKQAPGVPYHITLNTYSVEHEAYLGELLDRVRDTHPPIQVVYSGFGLFGLHVLYLNPAMNRKLLDLYDFVKERNNSNHGVFSAHTTVFIGEPDQVLQVLPEFVARSRKTSGTIEYVSLYEFSPARLIKRVRLAEE